MSDEQQQIDTSGAVAAYLNPALDQPARAAKAAMTIAAGSNPDLEAELRRVSERTGVPIDSARANPEEAKRQATLQEHDFDQLAHQFPSTTTFLTDPDNARIGHDDVLNLSSAEASIGPLRGPKANFWSYAGGLLKSFPQGAEMARQGIRMQLADLFGSGAVLEDAKRKYSQASLEQAASTPEFQGSTAQGVYSGLTSTIRAAPGLLASMATRSPTPMLAAIGVQTEADSYGKYRTRGASAGQAALGGLGEGAVEVATELLPMSFLVKNMGKVGAGHFLTGLLAREIPGEQIATLVQDAIDTAIANPDKTWAQYLAERPDAAYQTLLATITQAGLMEGANASMRRLQGRTQEAQQAGQVGDALSQFNALAEASKVRERDAATAQTFFQSLLQDGREHVWITPQALAESGLLEQMSTAIPDIAAQMKQAASTGADIRISIAELVAKMAGPELEQSIIPHLSEDPGGFTQTTAADYLQSGAAKELADEIKRMLESKAHDDAFTASQKAVTAGFQTQLDTAGRFAPAVNQAYATMVGNFYGVQAARLGITPEEMAKRYPLQVKAEAMPGVKTLEQPGSAPTIKAFDDLGSGFTVADGKLLRNGAAVGDIKLDLVHEPKRPAHLVVRDIRVDSKGKGTGTLALAAIMGKASQYGLPVALTSESMLGKAHQKRLRTFYERLGFKKNKGSDKVKGITEEYVWKPNTLDQTAYHGTPHKFDKFTLDHIGTGEGAQSYGYGLYFAGEKKVAEYYREGLTPAGKEGKLYTVEIPEDDKYLHLDKQLSDQPEAVKEALRKIADTLPRGGRNASGPDIELLRAINVPSQWHTGHWAYNFLANQMGKGVWNDDRAASELLNKHGIPGAMFADQLSRGKDGEQTFNYVLYDADSVAMVNTLDQAARGQLSFGDDITAQPSVITLLQNADLSTFLHESGHFFLEVLNDVASRPDAPADVADDMAKVLAWFGVPDLATWNAMDLEAKRPHHEAFARGFEAYLFEGRAPTADLSGLFSRFRSWMVNVYKSLTSLQVDLSNEVRGVFDRMLASSEAIAQAERDMALAGMFGTRPDFMTEEEWQAYRLLSLKASEEATRELETRSLKDMQWLSNAKGKVLAELQRDANAKRKQIREEVVAEVMAEPVNRARDFLRRGVNPDGSTTDTHKLSIASLIEMFGGEGDKFARLDWEPLGYGKYGALAKDGITPDIAAELFGYDSGEALVHDLLEQPKALDKIRDLTDQRMLERYGELIDEDSINRAVNEAVNSAAHIRFLATEMNALAKASGKPAVLAKAAKEYAEQIVRRTPIGELRPDKFTSAAKRAGRAADKAFKAGDIQTAAAEKQGQLINAMAAKAALDARNEAEKTLVRFKTITNGNNEKVAKTRDLDMVMATRAILAEYGVGTRGKAATEYLSSVEAYDPAMSAVLRERIDAASANAKPLKELTIEQLGALRDEVESLWFLAKRSRQMEVDGDLLDRQDIQDQLAARLEEIGVPEQGPGVDHAITPGEVALSKLQSLRAALRRVEAWAGAKDGNEAMGPFRKFIWNTIKDNADAYRAEKAKYLKAYRELLDGVAPTLTQIKIAAPELNYTFGFDKGGMGKVELLHAILHTGNIGNKKKMLLGRRWASQNEDGSLNTDRWDSFIARMIDEGNLTRADFDFAQGVWNLMEQMKPAAQKAHREVFGRYFDEVTADPFAITLKGGQQVQYAGGYVPAIADSRIVADAKTRAIMEDEAATLMNVLPSTSKGFTKSRVEYNRPLLLDLRLLSGHIDKVLLFSHLEQPVRDVRRVLGHSSVAGPLHLIDPAAYDGLLIPWLNRAARQQVETQVDGSNGLMRFFSVVRSRAGMAAMFANVSNTVQQITGFSLAALRVPPSYLMGAAVDFIRSPKAMTQAVAEASPYMANRMDNEVAAMTGAINDILLNPNVYQRAVGWTSKHTYFLQSAMDNVMGPIIWHGAYNQAMETAPAGLDSEGIKRYARQLADSAVRETQGSTLPEDISRIETGNAFVRMFTQFAGYFNMQANLLGTEFSKVAQDTGLRKGMGRGFYVLMFGFLVPAWAAQAIALAFRGGPDDDDKDGSYLDDWLAQTFGWGTLRAGTAMVPVVGQTANSLANTFNGKPYDDKISTGPAISMIESAVAVPADVYKLAKGEGSGTKTVRDVATLTSLMLGLPATALARPATFLTDVNSGKAKPTGPVDVGRGLVSGASSPASKGR